MRKRTKRTHFNFSFTLSSIFSKLIQYLFHFDRSTVVLGQIIDDDYCLYIFICIKKE